MCRTFRSISYRMRRYCNLSQQADRQSLGEETVTCAIVSSTNIIGLSKSDSLKSVGTETTRLSLSRLTSSHSANCSIDRSIADFTMYWRPTRCPPPPPSPTPACASENNYGHFQLFPGWKLWKRRRVNTQLRGFRGKSGVRSQQRLSNIPRKWEHKTMMPSVCSCGNLLFQHLNIKKTVTILVPQTKNTHNQLKNCLSLGFLLEDWKLPNMFGSCFRFFKNFFYFLCSNWSLHQQNNKESNTALFQIQLVSHSNSLPIIRQWGGGMVLVADVTMREGRKRMTVVKREREREREKEGFNSEETVEVITVWF